MPSMAKQLNLLVAAKKVKGYNMKSYTKLHIDFSPLSAPASKFKKEKTGYTVLDVETDINPELIALLQKHNIQVKGAQAFYTQPNDTLPIHVDDYVIRDWVRLNFVFGGEGSDMIWYSVPDDVEPTKVMSAKNEPFMFYSESDATSIESVKITENYPCIVQVGHPHNVINGDQERLCVSVWLNDYMTMAEACDKLADYIVK